MGVSTQPTVEEVLDTIGDEHARAVLAAIGNGPRSAKEIGEVTDLSLPTVYRRIELLKDHDLVESETTIGDDGNHYDQYRATFDATVIRLDGDEYDVRIYRRENLPDQFSRLWDDLSGERGDLW